MIRPSELTDLAQQLIAEEPDLAKFYSVQQLEHHVAKIVEQIHALPKRLLAEAVEQHGKSD
jgi:hypothetical protein